MFMNLKQSELQPYHISGRVICLSGDIEENPGPLYEENTNSNLKEQSASLANSGSLFEIRLSELNLSAIDVGGGGDCFFRAVSHQLYGNPNSHLSIRTLAVNYLVQNPDQFIESNTEHSWQGYLNNMSCQGTWADAIIVQAVANCLNLTIYIVESNESFAPLTVIQPINLTAECRNIVIGHIDETHYVSTIEININRCYYQLNTRLGNFVEAFELIDFDEKRRNYLKDYKKERRADEKSKQINPERVKECDKQRLKKKRKAENPEVITKKVLKGKYRKKETLENEDNFISVVNSFHNNIKRGPEYVCTCCDQLWYRSSVVKCDVKKYKACSKHLLDCCITGVKSFDNFEYICFTCHSNIKDGKLPSCSKANGMSFPMKCELLNLTPLEERLISPRIPFMQIRELPRGGQLSIHGNIVNVPSDINSTIRFLPRPISESQTIPVKLKRRLGYKHHYQFQNIRPNKVLDAAKYLVETSELFKNEGIEVQSTWIDNISLKLCENDDWCEFLQNPETLNEDLQSKESVENCNKTKNNTNNISSSDVDNSNNEKYDSEVSDSFCEVDERPSGVTDTLLQEPDVTENAEKIICFAPGEGNKPLGIFMDKDSEYLSFPTIFCGKRRPDNKERKVPVTYGTVAKWELRCQDRRVAMSVPNIFYKLKKLQIKQIQDTACIALRKCKTKGKKYTAGDFKSDNYLNKLVHLDEGFRVLKNLRASPAYFERCKRDLFAMIRQLGNPTWFCSFSAAETRWTHLLQSLGRIVEKKEYSDDDIKEMTWKQKSDLIQKDPVTCARSFDHMVQLFIRDVLKCNRMPIGEIEDYFYRVEFQQRGSPHIHCLFWIKHAPQYQESTVDEIVAFVDKYITCQQSNVSNDMKDLVNLQMHRHAKTCKKGGHNICRFNFPLPPMPRTMILTPLDIENDEEKLNAIKKNTEKINEELNNMKYGEDITFKEFLKKLQLTEQSYILAIRHSLKRDTLFLKRTPLEIRINNYNTNLLKAWQANMDIQYVLDPYACATYILSYITKGQRGMSRLLEKAAEEIKSGNKDIKNRVRHIGNKFLNAVEISAQEAVYLVLQMPL